MQILTSIPTTLITGFLGAGKSTAILHLLNQKPAHERWAILVNEFGKIGIDGSQFQGQKTEEAGVFVREVAGGCMCCRANLTMRTALNQLLRKARPDRLLIETTGLGHPKEVLTLLTATHYEGVLDLGPTITLVDARKIRDPLYTHHDIFNQQLAIADIIVANKADQYQPGDLDNLVKYLKQNLGLEGNNVRSVTQGRIEAEWLFDRAKMRDHAFVSHGHDHLQHFDETQLQDEDSLPQPDALTFDAKGSFSVENEGEGFVSRGWIFNPELIFDADRLHHLLSTVKAVRIKGTFVTNKGVIAHNKADNALTVTEISNTPDSRIEFICTDKCTLENMEVMLHECILDQ